MPGELKSWLITVYSHLRAREKQENTWARVLEEHPHVRVLEACRKCGIETTLPVMEIVERLAQHEPNLAAQLKHSAELVFICMVQCNEHWLQALHQRNPGYQAKELQTLTFHNFNTKLLWKHVDPTCQHKLFRNPETAFFLVGDGRPRHNQQGPLLPTEVVVRELEERDYLRQIHSPFWLLTPHKNSSKKRQRSLTAEEQDVKYTESVLEEIKAAGRYYEEKIRRQQVQNARGHTVWREAEALLAELDKKMRQDTPPPVYIPLGKLDKEASKQIRFFNQAFAQDTASLDLQEIKSYLTQKHEVTCKTILQLEHPDDSDTLTEFASWYTDVLKVDAIETEITLLKNAVEVCRSVDLTDLQDQWQARLNALKLEMPPLETRVNNLHAPLVQKLKNIAKRELNLDLALFFSHRYKEALDALDEYHKRQFPSHSDLINRDNWFPLVNGCLRIRPLWKYQSSFRPQDDLQIKHLEEEKGVGIQLSSCHAFQTALHQLREGAYNDVCSTVFRPFHSRLEHMLKSWRSAMDAPSEPVPMPLLTTVTVPRGEEVLDEADYQYLWHNIFEDAVLEAKSREQVHRAVAEEFTTLRDLPRRPQTLLMTVRAICHALCVSLWASHESK